MAKTMLIDSTHAEEHRVAIMDGKRLDDYEAESSTKKQLKGNIYLAKVIRIEPSLQAAFVEFGSNRHGFLPFAEIHPDYYRIPVSDRPNPAVGTSVGEEKISSEAAIEKVLPDIKETPPAGDLVVDEMLELQEDEESFIHRPRIYNYKIQEVIKRRQIMLIQVAKEERGNKGAALTTYLSLPGRYCVLMPNAGHRSGGISRKITDVKDRKRLRDILNDLPIPEGTSLIVRTAGQDRNKLEIRRDFEYLLRLWSEIRQTTLSSIAPQLIYAEGDLIKRTIRDNYGKEIDEIWVEGEEGYKEARAFMKTLIPSHVKKVKFYKEHIPLFRSYGVEAQIDEIMSPIAILPSGGSLVINPTEALVAVDVNSGKSTKERHIDETAVKTNLEAADEIARQMRLRDLGGLVVVDFIDMNDTKHIQAVEKRLKDAVRNDRARIQIGRISQFGLLELSRQRLRPSITEANMKACPHCRGVGSVRSIESMALHVLRAIESEGISKRSAEIVVTVPSGVDLYLLNQKRNVLISMEQRFQLFVQIQHDDSLISPDFRIDSLKLRTAAEPTLEKIDASSFVSSLPDDHPTLEENQAETVNHEAAGFPNSQKNGKRRRGGGIFNNRRHQEHSPKKTTPEEAENLSSDTMAIKEKAEDSQITPTADGTDLKKENNRRRRHRRFQNRRHRNNLSKEGQQNSEARENGEGKQSPPRARLLPLLQAP